MSGNSNTEPGEGAGQGNYFGPAYDTSGPSVANATIRALKFAFEHLAPLISSWWENDEHKKKIQDLEVKNMKAKLDVLEELLVERQHLFCSYIKPKSWRLSVEKDIRRNANDLISDTIIKEGDLDKIFREDRHCKSCLSSMLYKDKRQNGRLMWKMLEGWREAVNVNNKDEEIKKSY